MKIQKEITLFVVGFILIGVFVAIAFPKEQKINKNAILRIGAGDDISGLLLKEIEKEIDDEYMISGNLESSSFQDCWSNIAQWALSAEEINVAFYCSHIAKHTLAANEDIVIYGPVVMNAEVVCYKGKWDDIKTVGISQGREQEKVLAKRTYPQIENFMDITQKGILYTLEGGQVDAVIQDITKAAKVSEYSCRSISADDYISYVLVVKKEFVETDAFSDFIKSYNRAVDKLNNKAYLADILEVQESWIKEKEIKFLTLDER